jgi:ABC-2 type transport system ATP-binding protein
MTDMDPAISIEELVVAYGDKQVLSGLSFAVAPGEIVAYLGPNGSGKSTTMKVLTGQLAPVSGDAFVAGVSAREQPLEVRRRVGYVPETAALYDVLSAMEYLELVGRLRGLEEALIDQRALGLLSAMDLEAVAYRPLSTYSRGMRQRVVFSSAFLHDPEVVLLDEPLYGLDAQTVMLVKEVIRQLAARGKAVIYCSHLLEIAQQLATRVVILHEGRLVADGAPSLLRQEHADATLESIFRELTRDLEVESRAERFLQS